jgi:hypothetical protein
MPLARTKELALRIVLRTAQVLIQTKDAVRPVPQKEEVELEPVHDPTTEIRTTKPDVEEEERACRQEEEVFREDVVASKKEVWKKHIPWEANLKKVS